MIHPDDQPMLAALETGSEVSVRIDIERRMRLSLSHTASHLLYVGIGLHRPDAIPSTLGCHIKPDGARFDFGITDRFTSEQIEQIQASANQLVAQCAAITISADPKIPDARKWHCDGHAIPCGGTHLDNAAAVGPMHVRRKRLGAGKERLSCEFSHAVFDRSRYHP